MIMRGRATGGIYGAPGHGIVRTIDVMTEDLAEMEDESTQEIGIEIAQTNEIGEDVVSIMILTNSTMNMIHEDRDLNLVRSTCCGIVLSAISTCQTHLNLYLSRYLVLSTLSVLAGDAISKTRTLGTSAI